MRLYILMVYWIYLIYQLISCLIFLFSARWSPGRLLQKALIAHLKITYLILSNKPQTHWHDRKLKCSIGNDNHQNLKLAIQRPMAVASIKRFYWSWSSCPLLCIAKIKMRLSYMYWSLKYIALTPVSSAVVWFIYVYIEGWAPEIWTINSRASR